MIKYRTYFSSGRQRIIRLYGVWCGIKQRCIGTGKDNHNYKFRGIGICDEWLDFDNFRAWAIQAGYRKGLTIDRTNNDGDYSPDNCCWVTKSEQGKNTRRLVYYTYRGESLCIAQWASRLGLTHTGMRYRLLNWPIDKAMTEPLAR